MSHLLDDDDELSRSRNERELTLSTGSILGIFFGLVLLCGLFFGFGYNMGRRSTPVIAGTAADSPYESSASANAAYSSKPSAGSTDLAPAVPSAHSEASASNGSVAGVPPHSAQASPAPVQAKPEEPSAARQEGSMPIVIDHPAAAPTISAASANGTFFVQVAAVSHQEDAELLVSALQRKGYSVAARNEPGDKLVHIQVGPFNDHREADAMRQRLLTDGYNAMIKQL